LKPNYAVATTGPRGKSDVTVTALHPVLWLSKAWVSNPRPAGRMRTCRLYYAARGHI